MKLASLRHGRDGRLVLVSGDLRRAVAVPDVAPTLQALLDDWATLEPALAAVGRTLQDGSAADAFDFDPAACAAPLPRAYQWSDGSAYVNHVALVRKARGAAMPERFWHEPLLYQGGSDDFIGPCDDIVAASEDWGVDFEGEVAVITDDVPQGIDPRAALDHVRLVVLVNDVSLRALIPDELEKGFGFYQSKPATCFAPLAVTPDELGDAWRDGRVHLPLSVDYNGRPFGRAEAGEEMTFGFGELLAHAAKTRNLRAGSIVGSGTVSNRGAAEYGSPLGDGGLGYSCIAELRTVETLRDGAPSTPFMSYGDRVRIEMLDADGRSIFGAIDQQLAPG